MKTRSPKKISKTQKMVSEDILAVHSIAFSLWGTTSKLASLPSTGAPKASPLHTCFPSPRPAPAPPAGARCPPTCSLAPGHVLSTLAPRAVHPLSQSSISPNPALKEEPMKASQVGFLEAGRGARSRHCVGSAGSGNVPVPMFLLHPCPHFLCPSPRVWFLLHQREEHMLSAYFSRGAPCPVSRDSRNGALPGAWLELGRDTTSPGDRGGEGERTQRPSVLPCGGSLSCPACPQGWAATGRPRGWRSK